MDWKYLFTSFEDRISRQPYWLAILALVFVFVILFGAFSVILPFANRWIFIIPIYILSTYFGLALGIKRLHDRNKSGHWMWLFAGVPAGLNFATYVAKLDQTSVAGMTLNMIGFAFSIWVIVEFGFLRGTQGPNKYGPDPLEPGAQKQDT